MPSSGIASSSTSSTPYAEKASRLTFVFTVHRFIAGGFGCLLFFAPQYLNEGLGRTDDIPFGEKVALQSWGAFIIAVAIIVHFAQYLELASQITIGLALSICFLLLVVKYAFYLAAPTYRANMPPEYAEGIIATGGIFLVLLMLYVWALTEKRSLAHLGKHLGYKSR